MLYKTKYGFQEHITYKIYIQTRQYCFEGLLGILELDNFVKCAITEN